MNDPIYSDEEKRGLACVLDEILPPSADGRLPGAGELGLADAIERAGPDLRPTVVLGLTALDTLARERGAGDFASLPPADRRALLDATAEAQPGFVPGLLFQTYMAYYQHPRVLEGLGMEPRPPFPQGYPMEAGDLSSLDAVRARKKLYRDA